MSWPEPVQRVAAVLEQVAAEARLEEFPDGTPTAEAAGAGGGVQAGADRQVARRRRRVVRPLAFLRPPLDLGSDRSTMLACPARRRPSFVHCQVQWAEPRDLSRPFEKEHTDRGRAPGADAREARRLAFLAF